MFTTNEATVQHKIGPKGFGFLCTKHGDVKVDIFVHENHLKKSGYVAGDIIVDSIVGLDYKEDRDGRFTAVRIFAINGKTAVPPAQAVTIDQFFNKIESAHNENTGEVIWRILDSQDNFIQYLATDAEGVVTRQLGRVDVTEARVAIGLRAKATSTMSRKRERLQNQFPMAAE